jgi:hypothetical protein
MSGDIFVITMERHVNGTFWAEAKDAVNILEIQDSLHQQRITQPKVSTEVRKALLCLKKPSKYYLLHSIVLYTPSPPVCVKWR